MFPYDGEEKRWRETLNRRGVPVAGIIESALDPIPWTSSERWIRCPAWHHSKPGRRVRRQFSEEFKEGAVRLVLDEGKTVGAVARELDLTASALEPLGPTGPSRADEGQERADEGRARGADAAPEGESRAAHRARPPKKSLGLLRQAPAVAFAAIDAEKAHYPVHDALSDARRVAEWVLCLAHTARIVGARRKTGGSRSSCTPRSPAGRGYYGSPRIHDDFLEWGEHVSRKRIIRLMQEDGLKARVRKRYKGTTMSDHDQPVADNLLQQDFTRGAPESAVGRRHERASRSATTARPTWR